MLSIDKQHRTEVRIGADAAKERARREREAAKAKADAAVVYSDPEHIGAEADVDSTPKLPTEEPVVKDKKRSSRERRDQRAVSLFERNLTKGEMIEFVTEHDKTFARNQEQIRKAKGSGKFMLEYGSTFDPEWDGEFNNYGLPAVHPYTEGVKLPTGRTRTPKKERFTGFDKKKLTALANEQCETDNRMIAARVEYDFIALELEVAKVEQEFSGEYSSKKEKRWLRDSKKKLKNLNHRMDSALRYEKLDNERYYSVVATDFDKVDLPAKADREALIGMREELMRLLDIRDEINTQLVELYTGSENGAKISNIKGRAKAVLKARKRAHNKFRRYYALLNKHRVTRNEKMRIFDKMDEIVDLKGQIAKCNYILRKERPVGKVRRECIKDKKRAKRDVRIIKKSIERSMAKVLKKARRRERRIRAMMMAYIILAILGIVGLVIALIGPQILEASKMFIPEDFHGYIDNIVNGWPL